MAHVYHWKHGWIPLDHTAALSKAKGNHKLAATYLKPESHERDTHAPHGYKITEDTIQPAPGQIVGTGRYSFQTATGQHHYVGGSKVVATRRAHDHAEAAHARELEAAKTRADREATQSAEDKAREERRNAKVKFTQPTDEEGHLIQKAHALYNPGSESRINADELDKLANSKSEFISEETRKRAKQEQLNRAYKEAQSRLSGQSDEQLQELRGKIGSSGLSKMQKMAAMHYIDSRLANGTARFNADGSDMHTAERATRDAKASEQAAKAQQLRAAAETKRAEADRIAGRVGVGDSAAGRLNARGLKQFHQNTDSSLKRYTEANNTAFILDHKAGLAEARAKEAARARLTAEDIKGATHVKDQHGWHEVVRVNAKSVTVKTGHSWTDSIPHDKVHDVRRLGTEELQRVLDNPNATPEVKANAQRLLNGMRRSKARRHL